VFINGMTQPGYGGPPIVGIDGSHFSAGPGPHSAIGMTVSAFGCIIQGLLVQNFDGTGVLLGGGDDTLQADTFQNNSGAGVVVQRGAASALSGAGSNNLIGTPGLGNQFLHNGAGVSITGTGVTNNVVAGNTFVNDATGVLIANGATTNFVGGTVAAAADVFINWVSGTADAVVLSGAGTSGNVVEGCLIGVTASGGLAGFEIGVAIQGGAADNTIGGGTASARNQICSNLNGILITGASTTGNVVANNYIGTNAAQAANLGNVCGVVIAQGATGNTVGPGNVISGNYQGVALNGATGNTIQGNSIGTTASGKAALPNHYGVLIENGATNNTIGGGTTGAGNVVSGNLQVGIFLRGAGTTGNMIEGNDIGTLADGTTALGNGAHGILVSDMAANNTVGGITSGFVNVIADNAGNGVLIGADPNDSVSEAGTGNPVEGNAIFGNHLLGIDLGPDDGVTPNGFNGNVGPNNYQNYPVLTSAALSGGQTVVQGTLQSTPSTTFRVEFFANPTADPSGHGQGKIFLGFATVMTDSSGAASFTAPVAAATAGQAISATATDPNGNTSEFSADVTAA